MNIKKNQKCYNQEKRRLYVEKEKQKYINDFLSNPDVQYFYIPSTSIFIKYDGENYISLDEDELWFTILNDITNNDERTDKKGNKKSTWSFRT